MNSEPVPNSSLKEPHFCSPDRGRAARQNHLDSRRDQQAHTRESHTIHNILFFYYLRFWHTSFFLERTKRENIHSGAAYDQYIGTLNVSNCLFFPSTDCNKHFLTGTCDRTTTGVMKNTKIS